MSIKPSEDVAKFFSFLTGMPWPQADEDLMRKVSDNYKAMASDLDTLAKYIAELVPMIKEDFEGEAADAFVASMRDLIGGVTGSNVMQQTSELALQLGDAARNVANQVEYTKIMAILQVVELIAQILFAMIFGPVSFGASAINAALQFVIVREGLRNVLSYLLRTIITQTFIGITAGIFQDMVIQLYQLSSGHTDKWDTEHTLEALKGGALNGLVAGPLEILGHYGGQLLGKLLGKDAGSIISKRIDDSITGKLGKELADAAKENGLKTTGKGLAKDELNTIVKKDAAPKPPLTAKSPVNDLPGTAPTRTASAGAVSKPGATAGTTAGANAGTKTGANAGSKAGANAGTNAGASAGTRTGTSAGSKTGSTAGSGAGTSATGSGRAVTGGASGTARNVAGDAGAHNAANDAKAAAGVRNSGTKTASEGLDGMKPTAPGKSATGKGLVPDEAAGAASKGTRTASQGLESPNAKAAEAPDVAGAGVKDVAGSAAADTAAGVAKGEKKAVAGAAEGEAKATAGAAAKGTVPDSSITKLLTTDAARSAFAKDVGKLLGAAGGQIEQGFVRQGKGSIAHKVSDEMGKIFEKHLAKEGSDLLKDQMRAVGKEFGETFTKKWGRLAADHTGLGEALEKSLGDLAGNKGLKNLANDLPDLFSPSKITGNAFTQPFKRMFQTTPLHGNPMYQLGLAVSANLKDGVQNNLSEGFYNLIFSEEHEFTTTWSTFVSGMAMGALGKALHKLFEPAMNRYAEWFASHQFKANPNDSKYFGALHPLNVVSFLANMTGHQAPYPVPRPTSFEHDVTFKQQTKDMVEWVFSHPFTGRSFFDRPLPVLTPEHDADHTPDALSEADKVADALQPKTESADGPGSDKDPKHAREEGDGDAKDDKDAKETDDGTTKTDEGSAKETAPGRAVGSDGAPVGSPSRPRTEGGLPENRDTTAGDDDTTTPPKNDDAEELEFLPVSDEADDADSGPVPPDTGEPLPEGQLPPPTVLVPPTARPFDSDTDQGGSHIEMGPYQLQHALTPPGAGNLPSPSSTRLLTRPIRDASGEEVGLSFHHEPDWKLREQSLARFGGTSGVYQVHEENKGYDQARPFDWSGTTETVLGRQAGRQTGGDLAAPWQGEPRPFFLNLHSNGAGVKVLAPGDHDYRTVTLRDFGTQIKERVSSLPPGAPLVLTACRIGRHAPELQQFADITGRKVYASTAQTYSALRPRPGTDESAVGSDRYEGVIAMVSDPSGPETVWTSATPRPQTPEVAAAHAAPPPGPLDPAGPRRFVHALTDHGAAQLGMALPDRLPVRELHARLRQLSTDETALDAGLAGQLHPDALKSVLPYLLHKDGWPVPAELLGGRAVRLRLQLSDPQEAHPLGTEHGPQPETRLERRAGAGNEFSQALGGGNRRRVTGTYGETLDIPAAGILAKAPWNVSVSVTHNELTHNQNLSQGHQAVQALRSNESSTPHTYKATWVIESGEGGSGGDGSGPAADDHRPVTETEPLTVYFPQHLLTSVEGVHQPPTVEQLRTAPLWGVAGIGEPGGLAQLVEHARFRPTLDSLSAESLAELHHWTSEESLRGGLPIAVSGEFFSSVLHDTSGRALGFFGLKAVVDPQGEVTAVTRSMNLESHNLRFNRYTGKSTLTSSLAFEGGGQAGFTSSRDVGHPGAGTAFGGAVGGKVGGRFQASEDFSAGGGAQLDQSLRSPARHLLVGGTARYTVTFHEGLPPDKEKRVDGDATPLSLYVPARSTLDLQNAGTRRLPPELDGLRSLGMSATATQVKGAERHFEAAMAELTTRHYLPGDTAGGASDGPGAPDRRTQLMNLHRLKAAWSEFALRGAAGEIVDGGHVVRLDDPRPGRMGQIQVRLTAELTGEPPRHMGTLDKDRMALSNSVSHTLPASGQRTTSPSGTLGFTGQVNMPFGGSNWQAQSSVDPGYAYTRGTAEGWSTSVSHDQQIITKDGVDFFDAHVTYRLDISDGGSWRTVGPAEATDPGTPSVISLAVAHDRTTAATAAEPVAAPAAAQVLRTPAAMDERMGTLVDPEGVLQPGVVTLPGDSVVEHVRGAHVLQDVVREMLRGRPPREPAPQQDPAPVTTPAAARPVTDLEAQRQQPTVPPPLLHRVGPALADAVAGGALSTWNWLTGKPLGDVLPHGHVLLDSQLNATALLARGHQVFGGTYVVEHATGYGAAADHHLLLEVKGYLHASTGPNNEFRISRQGDAFGLYTETGITHADSSTSGDTSTHGGRVGGSLAFKDTGPQASPNAGTPSGGYQYTRDTTTASSRTTALTAVQVPNDAGHHHRVRLNATYEITLRQGWRSGTANMLGFGQEAPVRRVVTLPDSVGVLLTPEQLLRHRQQFETAGLDVGALLPPGNQAGGARLLPDRFAGAGHIGQGSVDEVTLRPHDEGIDAPGLRREPLRERLTELIDRIAPGVRTPGHSSHVAGVETALTNLASPAVIRSLPSRSPGAVTLSFEHHALGGADRVEVSLQAKLVPGQGDARGTELPGTSGVENQTHLTRTAVAPNLGTTAAHTYSFSPQVTYPHPPAGAMNDRSGATVTGSHAGTLTQPTTRFSEKRTWLRTEHVTQFDGIHYEYTVSVRRTPLHLNPLHAPGNVVSALSGRPRDGSFILQGRGVMRFPVVDTPLVEGGQAGPRAWQPGLPLPAPVAPAEPAAPAERRAGPTAFVPVRHFSVLSFDALPGLASALTGPRNGSAGGGPSFLLTSASHQLNLLGDLVRARGGLTLDPSFASVFTGTIGTSGGAHVSVRLSNPEHAGQAAGSASIAVDRVSRQGTTSSASSAPRAQLGADYVQRFGGSGLTVPGTGPNTRHSATNAASSLSMDIVKSGKTDAPGDDRLPPAGAPVQHVVRLDAEITVTGRDGTAGDPVRGRIELLVTEEDLLGHGLFDRSSRGHLDLRDISRPVPPATDAVPVADRISRLRTALERPDGTPRQVWFAADDHLQSADALYVAHRTAMALGRPVELVLRGDHGPESYRFAVNGDLETGQEQPARRLRALFDAHDTAEGPALADAARTLAEARREAGEFSVRPLSAELVANVYDAGHGKQMKKAQPWEVLKSADTHPVVLSQPGYATGDQFAIAAALREVPRLHVAISQGSIDPVTQKPRESEDKAMEIRNFYLASGIDRERIHLVTVDDLWKDKKLADAKIDGLVRILPARIAWTPPQGGTNTHGEHLGTLERVLEVWNASELWPTPVAQDGAEPQRAKADPNDLNRLLEAAGLLAPSPVTRDAEVARRQEIGALWHERGEGLRATTLPAGEALADGIGLSKTVAGKRNLPLNGGTGYVAGMHGPDMQARVRDMWRVSPETFPPVSEDHPSEGKVKAWLDAKEVSDIAGREVIVLWSRFSGKLGGAHLEHDTSYEGVRQIITEVGSTAAESGNGRKPIVLIVGDSHADPDHREKYATMAADLSDDHVSVHNLTAFWNTSNSSIREKLESWNGHDRIGQFKLYEYLQRQAASVRHLGFRSGNLEAMAMLGYELRYMEEPGSIGTDRMALWHKAADGLTVYGGQPVGYELLKVDKPPTRSGKYFNEAGLLGEMKKNTDRTVRIDADPPDFIHAKRSAADPVSRVSDEAKAEFKNGFDKGFTSKDIRNIVRFLMDTGPHPEGGAASSAPLTAHVLDGGHDPSPPAEPPAGPPATELRYRAAQPAYHVVSEVLKSNMKNPGAAEELKKRRDLRVTEYESPEGTVLKVESLAHRSDVRVERLDGRDYVRLYQTVYAPDGVEHKDIQQTADGEIKILPDTKDMWVNAGRPWRALHYMRTYRHQGHGRIEKGKEGTHGKPIVRSFLVPVETYNRLTDGAIEEAQVSGLGNGHALNTDRNKDSDQYLIRDSGVEEIRNDALPGSLRTYVLDQYQGEYLPGTRDGEVRTLSDMLDELSLPQLRDIPELVRPLPPVRPAPDPNGVPDVPNVSPPKVPEPRSFHLVLPLSANAGAVSRHVQRLQLLHDLLGPDLLTSSDKAKAKAQAQFRKLAGGLIRDGFPRTDQERLALRTRVNRAANYSYMPTVIEAVYKEAVAGKFGKASNLGEWTQSQDFPERNLVWTEKEIRPAQTEETETDETETAAPADGDAVGRGTGDVDAGTPTDLHSFPSDTGSDYPAVLANAVRTANDPAYVPPVRPPGRTRQSEFVQTARDTDFPRAAGTGADAFQQSIQDVLAGGSSQAHTPQFRARRILDGLARDRADGDAIALASTIAARDHDVTIVYVAVDGSRRTFGTGRTEVFLVDDGTEFLWSVVRTGPVA
ncbi:hypothetical protein J7F03_16315 [Streptomyces sp. ISL-43]|uniref:WXG100-like domain-containing protein n=1 Tax=Streptomyces sp. ISL-43 TaxID=2819183 RepID=UPI001BEBCC17|nr:hypothetical protein [Streptomyces sp. ISL-43]MBT2448626.1 hypothetical protein [Streptomyces sp. ISL-43]